MAPKRKRSGLAAVNLEVPLPPPSPSTSLPKRKAASRTNSKSVTNPDENLQVLDGLDATKASPDSSLNKDLPLNLPVEPAKKKRATAVKKTVDNLQPKEASKTAAAENEHDAEGVGDIEAEGDEGVDEEELKDALSRPPPINSDYLPLPWKGRLGYVGTLF